MTARQYNTTSIDKHSSVERGEGVWGGGDNVTIGEFLRASLKVATSLLNAASSRAVPAPLPCTQCARLEILNRH